MPLILDDLKAQCNVTDDADDAVIARCLLADHMHIEAMLGRHLHDEDEFPGGLPADVEQAILMVGAHFYENREATLVGVTALPLPMGVEQIIANHRSYTFG
ncbi:phage gp6-like head-tail connector protein [Aliihoeflea aestuarii]|jgi:hypothetical protein|uniref:head-tail connector protein n=1 Tax=Aliihoeflea aestuarii TaxID=453840 RepID=UPI002093B166|nr:head-tail connector protein [Aliihoeflea aestuarii]MCO6390555.1 phage gp6-like head-tail connector protein [Aliihoeflea aestuarii]